MDITELFETRRGKLVGIGVARGFSRDDAHELASEAFVRLLSKPAEQQTEGMLILIHNGLLVDSLRTRPYITTLRERPIGVEVALREGQSYLMSAPVTDPDEQLFVSEMRDCLARCEPRDAEAFALHYINGLTYDEIGQRLGVTRQAIHLRAEKARLRIIEEVAA